MSEEKEEPQSEDKESSKKLKDKLKLVFIFPNFRKFCVVVDKPISFEKILNINKKL